MRLVPNAVKAHKLATVVVAVVALGGATAGVVASNGNSAASFVTEPVSYATISQAIATSGTIEPQTALGLNFGVAGVVASVDVQPGQEVTAGQVLASLDTTNLQSLVTEASAALAEDQARLSLDEAGATPQELASAEASLASAETGLSNAQGALPITNQVNAESLALAQQAAQAASTKMSQDQQTLITDRSTAQNWCANNPSSSECAAAQAVVTSATQLVQSDQASLATDLAQVTATQVKNAQSVDAAQASVSSAETALQNAQTSLVDTESVNTENLALANDAVSAAQTNLAAADAALS